jgi:predicted transcriptional regulator
MAIAFETIPKEIVSKSSVYDYKVPLASLVEKINEEGAVIVTRNNRYYGIVDRKALGKRRNLTVSQNLPVGRLAVKTAVVHSGTSINSAIKEFNSSAASALPYMENNRVKGMLKRSNILKTILSLHMLSDKKVSEAMSSPILVIEESEDVRRAKELMDQYKVKKLPVASEKGEIYGVLRYSDILRFGMKGASRSSKSSKGTISMSGTSAGEIASHDFRTVDADSNLESALRDFINNKNSTMIATRKGKPVGILTISNLFELASKEISTNNYDVMLSGLDEYTKEYESDILNEMDRIAEKIDRFSGIKVSYIHLNVKRMKSRGYELRAMIGLTNKGITTVHVEDFNLYKTLQKLEKIAYSKIKNQKELIITNRERD